MSFQSRFNRIIAVAYSLICLCAFVLFGFLYHENLERQTSLLRARLSEETQSLDYLLRIRYDAVNAARFQMEDYLRRNIFDISQEKMALMFHPSAEGGHFSQDKPFEKLHRIGNLTGFGLPETFSEGKWREIKAAYALNPLFRVLKQNIASFVSATYISVDGFQNMYPWQPSSVVKFSPSFYKRDFFQKAVPQHNLNREILWSDSYIGPNDRELMLTCGVPVYERDVFKGVIAIDFTLDAVDNFVDSIHYQDGRVMIVNERMGVLCDSTPDIPEPTNLTSIEKTLPPNFSISKVYQLDPFHLKPMGPYWVFRGPLKYAPWSVVFYMRADDLMWIALKDIGPGALLILIFAALLLVFSNRMILREFISPAQRLIKHIAHQGQGSADHYKDIPNPWYSWFEAVHAVFEENRKLVQKLEHHIHELDQKVAERTKAISYKNKALQKALDNLKQAQDQIIVQEKMAGLGSITAGIAHEIKNPLNFILNFSILSREFLAELYLTFKEQPHVQQTEIIQHLEANLGRIESHAKRADAIVRSMLLHARGVDDSPQLTEINDLLDENAVLALSAYRQKSVPISIEKIFEENLGALMVYRQDLGRVFLNLINNACYSMELKYHLMEEGYLPQLLLKTENHGESILVTIRDNGVGISTKAKKNIFNPFFTTKPAGSGTGLGLSLSYDIVTNQHHGFISVNSQEGDFAEFKISLPRKAIYDVAL